MARATLAELTRQNAAYENQINALRNDVVEFVRVGDVEAYIGETILKNVNRSLTVEKTVEYTVVITGTVILNDPTDGPRDIDLTVAGVMAGCGNIGLEDGNGDELESDLTARVTGAKFV